MAAGPGCNSVVDCADALTCEASAEPTASAVHARRLTAEGPFIMHASRGARVGDVLVANDYARFYITAAPGGDGYEPYAGYVIDADVTRPFGEIDYDGLDAYTPLVNVSPIAADSVTIEQDGSDGREARVRVEGHCEAVPYVMGLQGLSSNPVPVDVTLTYALGPDDRALRVETRVVNTTDTTQNIDIGDVLQLSDDESDPFAVPSGFDRGSDLRQLDMLGTAHEWRPSAIALFKADSQVGLFNDCAVRDQVSGDSAMWGVSIAHHSLEPGETLEATRYLAVARDVSSAIAARFRIARTETGRVRGQVHVRGRPIAGARVTLFRDPELHVFAGQTLTDETGSFESALELGHYYAVATGRSNSEFVAVPGRRRELADGFTHSVTRELEVRSGVLARVNLELAETAHVKISLRNADGSTTAGKVTFQAEDSRPDVLSSAGEHVPYPALGVRQLAWVPNGDGELDVEPGVYTVIASRGFDSSLDVQHGVELKRGETQELNLTVEQVVAHTGYVAIDSHVHGFYSQHGEATVSERVITAAAEGLRVHVATDHDWIADYSPSMPWAGVSNRLLSMPGVELTTIYGHHTLWPLESDPTQSRGGAIRWWNGGTLDGWYAQYRELGAIVRQVAHGGSYFAAAGYDLTTGTVSNPAAFTWDFNTMEVHNSKGGGGRDQLVPIWLSLIRNHHRIAPVAASDSHGRAPEVGDARTYVRVDDGPDLTAEAVARAVTELKTVPTTGPFIEFTARTANGRVGMIGDTLQLAAAENLTLEIVVHAPDWMPLTHVELLREGEVLENWDTTTQPSVSLDSGRARWFEHQLTVRPDANTWYVVQVRGDKDLSPVYPDVWPWALTSPIFVNVQTPAYDANGSAVRMRTQAREASLRTTPVR
jgi:hypothetical protein